MPPGRPKTKAASALEDLFQTHVHQFVSDGNVLPPTDEIWSVLRGKCSEKKTSKAIYTAALRWYKETNEVSENQNDSGEIIEENVSFETTLETSNTTLDESNTSNNRSPQKNGKKIKIQISPKVWRTIAPAENISKRKRKGSHRKGVRKYITLAPGLWTNVFAHEISKHDDIPCSWVFKRNKCYLSGEKYIVFEAKCNACAASLVGVLKKKPEENENVNIDIEIFDINVESHTKEAKKVKLTSRAARKLYSQNKKATVIRRNLLKNTTKMFKAPTSRTMTANAIRCAQYRQRMNEKISQCPMTALSYLKASNLYMDCIQRIGLDPFFVFYCTPEQKKLFHAFNERNKVLKVSCDATGGVVHKIGNYTFPRQFS